MSKQGGKSKSTSEKRKALMATSWRRGQDRKKKRIDTQRAAERANKAPGVTTAWQQACEARSKRLGAAHAAGTREPAVRNCMGYIQRTDGIRSWWEDPGRKDRRAYLLNSGEDALARLLDTSSRRR